MKEDKKIETRKTYTVAEIMQQTGLGKNAAYNAIARKQIPSIRIGARILVPKVLFDRLLEQAK